MNHNKNTTRNFLSKSNFIKFDLFKFWEKNNSGLSVYEPQNKNWVSGFTLIETLVAIAIFATSITALISISGSGINDNIFVKNKLIASHLAAEGVELVRNMRDSKALSNPASGWTEFLSGSPDGGSVFNCYSSNPSSLEKFCYIESIDIQSSTDLGLTALACEEGVCPNMMYDENSNFYGYSNGEDTNFIRYITISNLSLGQPDEVMVNSYVVWTHGRRTFTTSYQYNLFNWISF